MIEIKYTLQEQQAELLKVRTNRKMYKLCPESLLLARVSSAVCESELYDIVKKYNLCDVCDFEGLHISVAKIMVKCVVSVLYKYPRIRGTVNFIGSRKGYMSLLDRLADYDFSTVKDLGVQYIADSNLLCILSNSLKELFSDFSNKNVNALAQAISAMGIADGILLDDEDFSSKEIRQIKIELERAVATKQFPQGCASVESVIYHEMGHLLDYLCGISKDEEVLSEFNNHTRDELINMLSEYAATSVREFVAEGFSEIMSNPTPRPTALRILNLIDKIYSRL